MTGTRELAPPAGARRGRHSRPVRQRVTAWLRVVRFGLVVMTLTFAWWAVLLGAAWGVATLILLAVRHGRLYVLASPGEAIHQQLPRTKGQPCLIASGPGC
jgi:hypothetical protein